MENFRLKLRDQTNYYEKTISIVILLMICSIFCEISFSGPLFPLKISSDKRFFADMNGVPFYWLGDTQWDIFRDFKIPDAEAVLDDRAKRGFTVIQTMILGVGGGTLPNMEGEKPFINDDPETPNEAFFKVVDSVIEIAERKGLVIVLGIYHKTDDYGRLITMNNARIWSRWIGNRYRNHGNIIWSMFPTASDAYIPIVRELAAGLKEGDGGKHLITVHPDPAQASSSWIHNENWLDFNTIQTWKSDFRNYTMVTSDYAKVPVKPVINGEARYEAEAGTSPLQIRNGAYWSCLGGGFYTYGHGGNWMSPHTWRNWIDSPGADNMRLLGDIFRSLEWWKLLPDQSVISGETGQKVAARSSENNLILAYVPDKSSIDISMDKITCDGKVSATWINPATGDRKNVGKFSNTGLYTFNVPDGWSDALLLLEGYFSVPITSRLAVSRNKRYFVTQEGDPVFWLGNTQWLIYRGYTPAEAILTLKNIASKGFTVVGTMLVGTGDGTNPNKEGESPWLNNDPSTPNEKYFKNIDSVVKVATELGLYVRLGILHNAQLKYMSEGRGSAYSRWVAERYKNSPNVLYSIHGDVRNPELISMVREMAETMEKVAGKDILISQKPDPAPNSSGIIQAEPWLDFTQSQTWKWIDKIYPFVTQDYNRKPVKPTVMDEGSYENGTEYSYEVSPLFVRRQAYYTYLAGGHHTYGHNDSWRVLPSWITALDAPGAFQMGILKRIFTGIPEWWRLVPDQSLFSNGGVIEGDLLQLAARHEKGKWAIFYLGQVADINIRLNKLKPRGKIAGSWIDPRNGNKVNIENIKVKGAGSFKPPEGWEDAILFVGSEENK